MLLTNQTGERNRNKVTKNLLPTQHLSLPPLFPHCEWRVLRYFHNKS